MGKTTNYYTPESVNKLLSSIYYAEDSVKYLLSLPQSEKDSKYVTPELIKAYSDLIADCEELISTIRYYLKARLWTAKDQQELTELTIQHIANILAERGKNPAEALATLRKIYED